MRACIYIYIHVYTHVCMDGWLYRCMYVCLFLYICMYVGMCVCMYVIAIAQFYQNMGFVLSVIIPEHPCDYMRDKSHVLYRRKLTCIILTPTPCLIYWLGSSAVLWDAFTNCIHTVLPAKQWVHYITSVGRGYCFHWRFL